MKKILLDENVAIKIKEDLINLKYNVIHINDTGKGIPDEEVFEKAKKEERILVSGDDDFKANDFKYKIPIIWITPRARKQSDIANKVDWIIENINNYNINIEKAFISIRKDKIHISYKSKNGILAKVREREIEFDKMSKKNNVKELAN